MEPTLEALMNTPLAAPSDLAQKTGIPETDPDLVLALKRASNRFRGAVNHPVTLVTDDVVYLPGDGSSALRLPAAPIVGVPVVKVDGVTVTDFQTGRNAGILRRAAGWPDGLDIIEVTYTHGYAFIPSDIADLVLEVAEAALNMQAGIESIATGNESVKINNKMIGGGVTDLWETTVAKYALGRGDRS